jgi:hypothetical protein
MQFLYLLKYRINDLMVPGFNIGIYIFIVFLNFTRANGNITIIMIIIQTSECLVRT